MMTLDRKTAASIARKSRKNLPGNSIHLTLSQNARGVVITRIVLANGLAIASK